MSDKTVRIDDGGLAFPVPCGTARRDVDGYYNKPSGGMSLRDYFAAMAMQAIISTSENSGDEDDLLDGTPLNGSEGTSRLDVALGWVPVTAYAYADAMIAARKAGGT